MQNIQHLCDEWKYSHGTTRRFCPYFFFSFDVKAALRSFLRTAGITRGLPKTVSFVYTKKLGTEGLHPQFAYLRLEIEVHRVTSGQFLAFVGVFNGSGIEVAHFPFLGCSIVTSLPTFVCKLLQGFPAKLLSEPNVEDSAVKAESPEAVPGSII